MALSFLVGVVAIKVTFLLLFQVFDLSDVKPNEFVQYGLACLEQLAGLGDVCAKEVREKLRVVVCIPFKLFF